MESTRGELMESLSTDVPLIQERERQHLEAKRPPLPNRVPCWCRFHQAMIAVSGSHPESGMCLAMASRLERSH